MRAGLTFSVVGSLFDPGAPRRSSLGLGGADETGLPRTESPSPVFARVRRHLSYKTVRGRNGEEVVDRWTTENHATDFLGKIITN